MSRRICLAVAVLLVSVWSGSIARAQQPEATEPAQPEQATLKGLLDQAELAYVESGGAFRVAVGDGKTEISVVCGEQLLYEGEQGAVKLVWLFTPIFSLSEGRHEKPPLNLLRRIAELNDDLRPGSISVNERNGNVYYNSTFWLTTATPTILVDELSLAFYRLPALRDELLPYVQEE